MSSFFEMNDFYIINPASMDFLLDWIYIKKLRSSYITPFLKKYTYFFKRNQWNDIVLKVS